MHTRVLCTLPCLLSSQTLLLLHLRAFNVSPMSLSLAPASLTLLFYLHVVLCILCPCLTTAANDLHDLIVTDLYT